MRGRTSQSYLIRKITCFKVFWLHKSNLFCLKVQRMHNNTQPCCSKSMVFVVKQSLLIKSSSLLDCCCITINNSELAFFTRVDIFEIPKCLLFLCKVGSVRSLPILMFMPNENLKVSMYFLFSTLPKIVCHSYFLHSQLCVRVCVCACEKECVCVFTINLNLQF